MKHAPPDLVTLLFPCEVVVGNPPTPVMEEACMATPFGVVMAGKETAGRFPPAPERARGQAGIQHGGSGLLRLLACCMILTCPLSHQSPWTGCDIGS